MNWLIGIELVGFIIGSIMLMVGALVSKDWLTFKEGVKFPIFLMFFPLSIFLVIVITPFFAIKRVIKLYKEYKIQLFKTSNVN